MKRLTVLLLYLALLAVSLGAAAFGVANYLSLTRGMEPDLPQAHQLIGTNVALEQYTTDADLQRAFDTLKRAGITTVRQYFPWREIESTRGTYDWAKWDRLVNAAHANGIQLVAVLNTAPAWSQRAYEQDLTTAPPNNFEDYARFAGGFARRYHDTIQYYQIWDEPNVSPSWGRRNADPVEYAQMLIPAADAIRANAPAAKIVLAGLAMNQEVHRPHPYYSEILFLRGLYEIGAQKYFDIVAAKPYGMWTGPEDRTINSDVLNFSRLILLRAEMLQYGDAHKPVWAVEMGWNALPDGWEGQASPWGTDSAATQADRLTRGLTRAQNEWSWLTAAFPLYLQPNAAPDDPRWGFSLLTPDDAPRPAYAALAHYLAAPPTPLPPPSAPVLPVLALAGVAVIATWRAWHWTVKLHLSGRWLAFQTRVRALPLLGQFVILAALAAAFYLSPSVPLNFVLLALLVVGFALRLDLGVVLTIAVIPFWNFPKTLFGGFDLSPVETLTWVATAGFLLDRLLSQVVSPPVLSRQVNPLRSLAALRTKLSLLDWLVLAFLALALVSTWWAENFGVASREFRIIVLDPILLYGLTRVLLQSDALQLVRTKWFVNALMVSGVAVCAIGLYQFATGDVIMADGVGRLTAVWGSPNNVGLYLGRLLPVALTFALMLPTVLVGARYSLSARLLYLAQPRWVFAALALLFAVTIFLTFSRGALFLGVPASILFLLAVFYSQSHTVSRRVQVGLGLAFGVGVVALIPFVTTNPDRFLSLFQTGTGTGFFRVAVWTSAVNMIRDHPILGVGLDNFLYEYPKYILPEAWREPNLSHPHNLLLDAWVRLGIFGVILLGVFLVAFYRRAWQTFQRADNIYVRSLMLGLMASMVDFIAHGLIDEAYFVIDLAYVFMLTLALAQIAASRPSLDSE